MAASRSTNSARMRAASRKRRAGAGTDAVHLAVGAEQRGLDPSRAFAAPLQEPRELLRELLDGAEHILLARDRLGEAALRHIRRHRQARRDRLVLATERLVEAAHEIFAEARGKRRARAIDHVGDVLEADLRQSGDGFVWRCAVRRGGGEGAHRVSGWGERW